MIGNRIRVTEVGGTPASMGRAHGTAHGAEIRSYTADRVELAKAGTEWSTDRILSLAAETLDAHQAYDEALFEEMVAMAHAAGISPAEAVVVGGFTDFIDVVAARAGGDAHEDDCTAVLVPDDLTTDGGFLAQTWDMNASATPHVIMLDVAPDAGPRCLVFTTVGTLGQIGMNDAGIAVGINNLTAADGRIGVTWPFVVRKALRQPDFERALACITEAPLAGGHNFLVLSADGRGASVEAMPTATHVQRLEDRSIYHTNHCLFPSTMAVEGARPADLMANSIDRLEQAPDLLTSRPIDEAALIDLLRDEGSICRRPEAPWFYESCGAAVMRPATGDFWACWGIPSDNEFEHMAVAS